jgi:hypothetical protein
MLNQLQLRTVWAPPCRGPWVDIRLHGAGKVSVRPATYHAVRALNSCLIAHNYKTRAMDTGGYVCRRTTGSSSSYSLHAYGTALDINWTTNPYGPTLKTDMPRAMVNAICAIRTNNGKQVWNWGGFWTRNKDAMHYEIVCSPKDLATGINPKTVPGYKPPAPAPAPAPKPVDWAAVRRLAAADLRQKVNALPNMDGSTRPGSNVKVLQQALNLVQGSKLAEDGIYGRATIEAVLKFQQDVNRLAGKQIIKDFPGAAHDATRWMLSLALERIAKGQE